MRSAKKTIGAHEGWVLHVSEAYSHALRNTETLVLRTIANETVFVLVSGFALSRTAFFRKIHNSDVTTRRWVFPDASEERNAFIFGVKQSKKTVDSLSG
jgi:hypothetical protein